MRGSWQERSSALVRARSDDDVQLALAMSLSAYEPATAASTHTDRAHNSIREEFIDLTFNAEASIEAVEAHLDDDENAPWASAPTTMRQSPAEFRQPRSQRRISDSISDATIERLTGLSLH